VEGRTLGIRTPVYTLTNAILEQPLRCDGRTPLVKRVCSLPANVAVTGTRRQSVGRKKEKKPDGNVAKPGRLRSAWYVLVGRAKTIDQIHGEWAIIQAQAAETFNRFNALAARLIRAERNMAAANVEQLKALEADSEEGGGERQEVRREVDRATYKQQLRHRAAEARRQPIGRARHVNGDQGGEIPR